MFREPHPMLGRAEFVPSKETHELSQDLTIAQSFLGSSLGSELYFINLAL